jgi:hypothetical protein
LGCLGRWSGGPSLLAKSPLPPLTEPCKQQWLFSDLGRTELVYAQEVSNDNKCGSKNY